VWNRTPDAKMHAYDGFFLCILISSWFHFGSNLQLQ